MLVGGFPCQDYSVAQTGAKGIESKKGVLWWEIRDIVEEHRPSYILLENVDRLIKSPSKQRGRDFAIILRCLFDLGYAVEWRVINAAEYGHAQRRRRVFIFAYKSTTTIFHNLAEQIAIKENGLLEWVLKDGFFAPAFPLQEELNPQKRTSTDISQFLYSSLDDVSNSFVANLYSTGVMINGRIYSEELKPIEVEITTLRQIIHNSDVDKKFFLNGSTEKWQYLKGTKKIDRIKPNGEAYTFSEGAMCFPDNLDKPSRTMLTSESSVNRSTHVIKDAVTGKLRLLTPVECERLNGFDDNWTNTGTPHKFRYFTMGNALVVPIVSAIGKRIIEIID